jgi:hypothetical protein
VLCAKSLTCAHSGPPGKASLVEAEMYGCTHAKRKKAPMRANASTTRRMNSKMSVHDSCGDLLRGFGDGPFGDGADCGFVGK